MFLFFINSLRIFGLHGVLIYLKIKLNQTSALRLPGIKFPIQLRRNAADKASFREIFMRRDYDINIPSLTPKFIIDAGANIGLTSVFLTNKYPQAKIFSIEPDEGNYKCLVENTRAYPSIIAIKSALWPTKEPIQLVDKGYGERGFTIEPGESSRVLEATSVKEIMTTYHIDSIDILKIDIEGSEKELFSENYDTWLPYTKCVVIELHDRMKKGCSKAVFKAFTQYNFSLFIIKGENLIFTNDQYFTKD
jgi:FkbM family methyltransferase